MCVCVCVCGGGEGGRGGRGSREYTDPYNFSPCRNKLFTIV